MKAYYSVEWGVGDPPALGMPRDASGSSVEPKHFWAVPARSFSEPITIPVVHAGRLTTKPDIILGAVGKYLIVRAPLALTLQPLAPNDIQFVDARLDGDDDRWKVLQWLSVLDCIDEKRSKFHVSYERGKDSRVPVRRLNITHLAVDRSKSECCKMFRLREWPANIVDEDARAAIAHYNHHGLSFDPV